MKRLIRFTTALGLAMTIGACTGDDTTRRTDRNAGQGGAVGTSGSVEADVNFLQEQLQMGTAEIELGRLAQQRGTHADVKAFGAMMVRDHQTAAQELKPLASKVSASAQSNARANDAEDTQEKMEDLSKLSGREFDRKYIDMMIDDHEKAVKDVEGRAENAANPDVKAWAARTLPKMRQHLERAKTIKETLDRATD
jgi:putative membrane protein